MLSFSGGGSRQPLFLDQEISRLTSYQLSVRQVPFAYTIICAPFQVKDKLLLLLILQLEGVFHEHYVDGLHPATLQSEHTINLHEH